MFKYVEPEIILKKLGADIVKTSDGVMDADGISQDDIFDNWGYDDEANC